MTFDISISGYRIHRMLGEGGMAKVYLAEHLATGRQAAVKVMRHNTSDDSQERRFINEGRTLERLVHPNIVSIYDIAQNDQLNYISMEALEGGTLTDKLAAGLSVAECIGIVAQIADALDFAHDNGVIHRDLKPDNIMFKSNGRPVLTDFGIARLEQMDGVPLTRAGMVVGTPSYMSPEQAQGGTIDGRSDQYALGILFYEMLTGRLPINGDTPMEIATAQVLAPPSPLPAEFAFAEPLIDRMLAKKSKDRFHDLKAFAYALKKLVIQNQELRARLPLSSERSVSQQLQALGFSDAQVQGATGRRPAPVVLVAVDAPPGLVGHQLLEDSSLALAPKMPARPRVIERPAAWDSAQRARLTPRKIGLALGVMALLLAVVALWR